MRRLVLSGLAMVLMFLMPADGAGATIRVVATIPDLADMATYRGRPA
jgi:hypothetical protein